MIPNLSPLETEQKGLAVSLSNSEKLAIVRTVLALDRTLLAWIRSTIGITSFGFSFYKFFEYLSEQENYTPRHKYLGPRQYALLLIIFGNFALLLAIIDHFRAMKQIRLLDPHTPTSRVPLTALFFLIFGIFTLIATLFRV